MSERAEAAGEYLPERTRKQLADRLARLEGHLRSIREMVLERRAADEILLQTSAVKAALNQFSAKLLENELQCCVSASGPDALENRLPRVTKVLTTLLKQT